MRRALRILEGRERVSDMVRVSAGNLCSAELAAGFWRWWRGLVAGLGRWCWIDTCCHNGRLHRLMPPHPPLLLAVDVVLAVVVSVEIAVVVVVVVVAVAVDSSLSCSGSCCATA